MIRLSRAPRRPFWAGLVSAALALPAQSESPGPAGAAPARVAAPEAVGILRGLAPAATAEDARAGALTARNRLAALLARQERDLGPDHLETIVTVTGLAVVMRHLGDPAAAEPLLRRAVAGHAALFGPGSRDALDSRSALAAVLADLGRRDEARAELRAVLAHHAAAGGNARPEVVAALLALADVTDPPAAAVQVAAQARDLARKVHGPNHPLTARAHVAEALALGQAGQSSAAVDRLTRELARLMSEEGQPLESLAQAADDSAMAILAGGLVALDAAAGGPGAIEVLRADLDAAQRVSDLIAQGRRAEAMAALDALLDAALASGDRLRLARLLVLRQRIAIEMGDFGAALAAAEQELALRLELGPQSPDELSRLLGALSELARAAGHPDRAAAHAEHAARLAMTSTPEYGLEETFARLLRAQEAGDSPARRAELAAVHREIAIRLGNDHQIALNVELLLSAELPPAEALAIRSRVAARAAEGHPGTLLATQAARAEVLTLLEVGQSRRAFEVASVQVERLAAIESGTFEGGAESARRAAGDLIDLAAVAAMLEARRVPETANLLRARMFDLVQWTALDRSARALVRAAAEAEAADPALRALARRRAGAIETIARLRARREDVVALAMTDAPASRILAGDLGRETVAAAAALRLAEEALREGFPAYFELIRPSPRSLDEVQGRDGPALLGPDEAMVMLVPEQGGTGPGGVDVRRILVIAVTDTSADWSLVSLDGDEDLAAMIGRLRAGLVPAAPVQLAARAPLAPDAPPPSAPGANLGPAPFDRAASHAAYRALFGDPAIARIIGDRSHWILVPQGPLLGLPWNVLVTAPPAGDDADPEALRATRWLGTTRALSVLPTLSALTPPGAGEGGPGGSGLYVAFGDPDFAGPAAGKAQGGAGSPLGGVAASLRALPRLPATRAEVAAVSRLMAPGEAIVRTGPEASEGALRALDRSGALRRARVLHFATHGLLAGGLPGLSEPALALAPGPASAGAEDDGLLTASEISLLDLQAEWAFLSACDTAAGIAPDAEGLGGLAAAFFQAGARGLVVSHWAIDDTAAARLAVGALSLHSEPGELSRAEALRRAMDALVRDPSRDGTPRPWSHPALWAPFQMIGTR
jgi:hypothetical protein